MSKQTNVALSPVWNQLKKHKIDVGDWKDGAFPLYFNGAYVGSLHFAGNEATPCFFSDKKRYNTFITKDNGEKLVVSHMKMYKSVSSFIRYGMEYMKGGFENE